ncbi:M20 family metallopeptidase [Knoellia sp. p5-6-4]|uniref:M20 metallopeptidase family protein n=1 Tax=unclassified Knoellia TaxID=2618719 RepID=UPI0023D97C4A|nr:M20 family metallopeptidase [Knoellia sp. p5-6-4]MDF2146226.1 M20 family metallopeptidase [Knoellia sp. p5-6-4]
MRTLHVAQSIADDLVALRRRLHRVPELGNELPISQSLVLDALDGLGLEVSVGKELSSVVAVLRGGAEPADGGERQVVLLRGDMDGLPVTEDLDIDHASTHEGLMHACGHDLHVAGLVGAARVLHALRDDLAGDVVLMFQPGEEGPGGAEPMIREGVLEAAGRRVDAAYALHVYSAEFPRGVWFGRPGPLMAAADEVRVRVVGRGGHGSAPFRTKDPIPAACEMVVALQSMVTRSFDVFDPVVVTVGRIAGGTKDNIIPDDAVFEATLRTLSEDTRVAVRERIERLARGIAAAHGLEAEVDFTIGYPVTVNDPDEYAFVHETIVDLFGHERYATMLEPEMGSEDFSFVAQEVPSAYVNLSVCPSDDWEHAPDNHSPRAAFDDALLPDAAALLAELALRRLRR